MGFYKAVTFVAIVACATLYLLAEYYEPELQLDQAANPYVIAFRTCSLLINLGVIAHLALDNRGNKVHMSSLDTSTIVITVVGIKRFGAFTIWCWVLQTFYYLCAILLELDLIPTSAIPFATQFSIISFELCLSFAILVTACCTFVLIPMGVRAKHDMSIMFTLPTLIMHNYNLIGMVIDLIVNTVKFRPSHLLFAVLFGLCYLVFSWGFAFCNGWFFYPFIKYCLLISFNEKRVLVFYSALLLSLMVFFGIAGLLSHVFNPHEHTWAIPVLLLLSLSVCTFRADKNVKLH